MGGMPRGQQVRPGEIAAPVAPGGRDATVRVGDIDDIERFKLGR